MGRKIYAQLGRPECIAAATKLSELIEADGRGIHVIAEQAGLTSKRLELFATDIGPMKISELEAVGELLGVNPYWLIVGVVKRVEEVAK